MADCAAKGRIRLPQCQGERHGRHKLTAAKVRLIRILVKNRHSHSYVGKLFNISSSVITRIMLGQLWSTV
jgi:hypothetical protein